MNETYLKIENIELWARVGVLHQEREYGQLFTLDIFLWTDFDECSKKDDIKLSIDYSVLIKQIKLHARSFSCLTIEKYADVLIEIIKLKFNPKRIKIRLRKANPPIIGFKGSVEIVKIFDK